MRTPASSNASSQQTATLASRKKYKVFPTESLPGYENFWPKPYFPSKTNPYILAGNEVGRDQMYRAETILKKINWGRTINRRSRIS